MIGLSYPRQEGLVDGSGSAGAGTTDGEHGALATLLGEETTKVNALDKLAAAHRDAIERLKQLDPEMFDYEWDGSKEFYDKRTALLKVAWMVGRSQIDLFPTLVTEKYHAHAATWQPVNTETMPGKKGKILIAAFERLYNLRGIVEFTAGEWCWTPQENEDPNSGFDLRLTVMLHMSADSDGPLFMSYLEFKNIK